jgi:hypothetical protein
LYTSNTVGFEMQNKHGTQQEECFCCELMIELISCFVFNQEKPYAALFITITEVGNAWEPDWA